MAVNKARKQLFKSIVGQKSGLFSYEDQIRFHLQGMGYPMRWHVKTPGIDWGPLFMVHHTRRYQVWHKPTCKFFGGVGLDRSVSPAAWVLVKVTRAPDGEFYNGSKEYIATVLACAEPGRKWQAYRDSLLEQIRRLPQR